MQYQNFRTIRECLSLTATEIADKLNMSVNDYVLYETNKKHIPKHIYNKVVDLFEAKRKGLLAKLEIDRRYLMEINFNKSPN